MTEEPVQEPSEEMSLKDELRRLGENLRQTIGSAWESEERKTIQRDLEEGLTELASSLRTMAKDFEQSETARQMKSDLHDLNDRIQSGELQDKLKKEIFGALRKANEEIEKGFYKK